MLFQDLPIRRKLVGMMLLTSMLVLFAAAVAMLAYEYRSYRREMVSKLTVMAAMVADNSAAVLSFDDPALGHQILSSLRVEPEIRSAALYDAAGVLYARFPTNLPPSEFPTTLADEDAQPGFHSDHFIVHAPVNQGNKRVGTAYLKADFELMYRRLANYGYILMIVLFGAGLMAWFLATTFEWRISHPFLELAKVARTIAAKKDYSLRAVIQSRDELGYLTQAFNSMLAQIQTRDSKLRDSERRFREMIDALPAAVYTTDASGRLTHFNPAAIELAGRIPDPSTDKWCVSWKLFHSDGTPVEPDECPMALAMRESRPIRSVELIVERPDGTRVWVTPYPTPLYDADGQLTGGINMLVDITQRRQAEAALREREERYELVVAGAEAAIWDWDILQKRILYAPRWKQIRGLSIEEIGDSEELWMDGIHPEDRARVLSAIQDHTEGRTAVFADEYRVRHKDGHWMWVLNRGVCRRDAVGRVVRMAGSETDITDRKLAEEALSRSEARYRSIFEGVAVSLWEEDFSGVMAELAELKKRGVRDLRRYCAEHPEFVQRAMGLILVRDVNDCTVKMFEAQDKKQLLGSLAQIFPEESISVIVEELNALAEGRSFLQGEVVLRTVLGKPIHVLFAMSLPAGTGDYDRVLFSLIDITRRKRVEQALQESEQRFRMIADNIPVMAWTADPRGVGTWYNKQWHDYTQLTLEQSQGAEGESSQAPESFGRGNLFFQEAFKRGEPWQGTFPLHGRDGQHRWFLSRAVPIFDDHGNILRWFGTNVDVTELREAEQSVARLAAIVESSHDAIVSETLDGCIRTWNRAAERLFGYTAREAIGRSITMLIPNDRRAEESSIVERQRRGERIEHFETVRVRKDGTRIVVSLTVSPIRDSAGELAGISKIARDITEKKRAEEALERALEAAESANRTKDDFLAALSHELRTPLMPVLFTISVWQQGHVLPSKLEGSLAVIRRNIEVQSRMINDLLDLSRIRANRLELALEVIDLHEIIGRALEVCRSHQKNSELEVVLELEAESHHVLGDADRLQQVFWNLIQNSMKFTPAGGRITLRSCNERGSIRVKVADTGCGIDPELLSNVFEPFEQCGRKGKSSLQGLGLGLAIAQRIATAHGGTLTAASAGRDLGACFSLELQVVPAPIGEPGTRESSIVDV